jgi:hypothetical protein
VNPISTYILLGWLIPRVVLSSPELVELLTKIQQLQDLNNQLKTLLEK